MPPRTARGDAVAAPLARRPLPRLSSAGQHSPADQLPSKARSSSYTAQARPGRRRSSLPRLQSPLPGLLEGLWKGARLRLIAGRGRAAQTTHYTCEAHISGKSNVNPVCAAGATTDLIARTRRICRMRLQAFRDGSCAYPSAPLFCKDGGAGPGCTHRGPKTPTTALADRSYVHDCCIDTGRWARDFLLPQESAALRRAAQAAGWAMGRSRSPKRQPQRYGDTERGPQPETRRGRE